MRFVAMLPNGRGGLYPGCISVSGEHIAEVALHRPGGADGTTDFDFTPHVALPGFIDLQINGAGGHDITSEPRSAWAVGAGLSRHGVTAFAPTIITSPPQQRQAAYHAMRRRPPGYTGAEPVGLHIEGPALARTQAGAHPSAAITTVEDPLAEELAGAADVIALTTVAPELDGACDLIARLSAAGIAVSLGHSGATAAQTVAAIHAGARAFTHVFNGMAPLHHREVGIVGAGLLDAGTWLSLIADGHHLSDEMVQLVWRLAGAERIFLVSDSMAGTGAPPGLYRIGDTRVRCGETARDISGGLAGSLVTLPDAARRLQQQIGATWDQLALVTSTNAAGLLGDESRGRLAAGKRADIAIVDANFEPMATITGGSITYRRPDRVGRVPRRPARVAIGVDIGGSFLKAAIFDGTQLGKVHRRTTGQHQPAAEVLAEVRQVIDDLVGCTAADVVGVGIACPGVVDAAGGTVIEATNLGWRAVDVIAGVGEDLQLPVAVEHDVYLGAMAEWETGCGVGCESMLYVSIGTGVASQLFTASGTYRGCLNLAGEMGLIPIGDGPKTLESIASARAISDAYFWLTGRQASSEKIVSVLDNDAAAARVWSDGVEALARGIAAAVLLQDPEIIAIGGGVSNAGSELLDTLRPQVAELVLELREPPLIVRAAHRADSGIVGAALHAGLKTSKRR